MSWDQLAQRNLQFTVVDNPGPAATHRAPQTFDCRPSGPIGQPGGSGLPPDELMIDWGNVPKGAIASLYWPAVSARGRDLAGAAVGRHGARLGQRCAHARHPDRRRRQLHPDPVRYRAELRRPVHCGDAARHPHRPGVRGRGAPAFRQARDSPAASAAAVAVPALDPASGSKPATWCESAGERRISAKRGWPRLRRRRRPALDRPAGRRLRPTT